MSEHENEHKNTDGSPAQISQVLYADTLRKVRNMPRGMQTRILSEFRTVSSTRIVPNMCTPLSMENMAKAHNGQLPNHNKLHSLSDQFGRTPCMAKEVHEGFGSESSHVSSKEINKTQLQLWCRYRSAMVTRAFQRGSQFTCFHALTQAQQQSQTSTGHSDSRIVARCKCLGIPGNSTMIRVFVYRISRCRRAL